ncbi:MAG: FG-GAP-like repeat-containing protein, partial [Verrucomicrobiota bacterium]
VMIDTATVTAVGSGSIVSIAFFARDGGGIYHDETRPAAFISIDSSVVADNILAAPPWFTPNNGPDCFGALDEVRYALIRDTNDWSVIASPVGLITGVSPNVTALQDNGGPTWTHSPLNGSPLIDAGDPGFTPPPGQDQRAYQRLVGPAIDLGAVEWGAGPAPLDVSVYLAGPSFAQLFQPFDYEISVESMGAGTLSNLVVVSRLPTNLIFVSGAPGCVSSNQDVSCSLPELEGCDQLQFRITVTSTGDPGRVTNRVELLPPGVDAVAGNNISLWASELILAPFCPTFGFVATGGLSSSSRKLVGDLDNDGDADAMDVDTVWFNDGAGRFTSVPSGMVSESAFASGLADINGDGALDVAMQTLQGIRIFLNNGSGLFSAHGPLMAPPVVVEVYYSTAGDVDGDGDDDLVVFQALFAGGSRVWFNDGNANFTPGPVIPDTQLASRAALGDLDQDGDLDAFAVTAST